MKIRICSSVILSLVAAISINQRAMAQSMTETPIGKLGIQLVGALNSNSREVRLQFITTKLDARALAEGQDTWLTKFDELYRMTGEVEITAMQPGRSAGEVRMKLKSKHGNQMTELATRFDNEPSDRVIGFIFRSLDQAPPDTWPQGQLSESSIVAEIGKHMDRYAQEDRFSGAVLIAKKDRIIFTKAYGFADREKKVPNQITTKFNLGSMNKMFTSMAVAQLVQEGKLSYRDTLANVLPEYPNKTIAKKITIHDLLTHTSGLGDFFRPEFFEHREKYVALISYLPLFAGDPLLFEPGKGWAYSNAGFIVLGLVVEKVSGENYFNYVLNHIFKPAGMNDTDSYERDVAVPLLARGYTFDAADPQHKMPRHDNAATLPVKGSSAGGGYSTAEDLLLFTKAILGYRLLNEASTKIVLSGKVDDHHPDSRYAYGFIDQTRSGKHIVGHNGGGPGINGRLSMLTDNGYTVIVLSNYDPPSADEPATEISDFLIER